MQLKLIFIQKDVLALVFSWHLFETFNNNFLKDLCYKKRGSWLCIKTGIKERETECGERGEWGECYIPENVAKYCGKYPQIFRGILSFPGNVLKYLGKCSQAFQQMSSSILGRFF